jgi:sRNA-binding protein
MGKHLYNCIYDVIQSEMTHEQKHSRLRQYKHHIQQLYTMQQKTTLLDMAGAEALEVEEMTLHHVMKIHKRKEEKHIHHIRDSQGDEHTSPQDICRGFIQHFQRKYGPIDAKSDDIRVCQDQIPTPQETTTSNSRRSTHGSIEIG